MRVIANLDSVSPFVSIRTHAIRFLLRRPTTFFAGVVRDLQKPILLCREPDVGVDLQNRGYGMCRNRDRQARRTSLDCDQWRRWWNWTQCPCPITESQRKNNELGKCKGEFNLVTEMTSLCHPSTRAYYFVKREKKEKDKGNQ